MSEILQSTDMSDVKKQKMYNANMESYLSLKRQKDDQIPTVRIAQDAEQKSKEKASLSDADVIGHLPVTLRPKAATLLKRLKERPNFFPGTNPGKLKWRVKRFLIRIYRIWSVTPCGHARILILREHKTFFVHCQRLMCPKILQETRKDGRKFKWMNQLFSKHPRGNHCQHHRVSRGILP